MNSNFQPVLSNGELYHHGILGQKWGIRRFQNPDGTWTEAGKQRYGKKKVSETNKIKTWWGIEQQRAKANRAFLFDKKNNLNDLSEKFSKEMYKNRRLYRKSDSYGDFYYRSIEITNKFIDDYSRELLSNLGYDNDQESIDWLKKQSWYFLPNSARVLARDSVFV